MIQGFITPDSMLHLTADTATEQYALTCWQTQLDIDGMQSGLTQPRSGIVIEVMKVAA